MQVTRTMEMISTARIRRALDRAERAMPFKQALTRMLANVAGAARDGGQPLLQEHDKVKKVLFILIASDRGLAGGFNVTPERQVEREMAALKAKGVASEVITCGRKPSEYFVSRGITPAMTFIGISSEPTQDEADRIAAYVMEGYASCRFDEVRIYYWHAKNRVDQTYVNEKLLPLTREELMMPSKPGKRTAVEQIDHVRETEFEFDPSATEVLGYLIPAYVRTVSRGAVEMDDGTRIPLPRRRSREVRLRLEEALRMQESGNRLIERQSTPYGESLDVVGELAFDSSFLLP